MSRPNQPAENQAFLVGIAFAMVCFSHVAGVMLAFLACDACPRIERRTPPEPPAPSKPALDYSNTPYGKWTADADGVARITYAVETLPGSLSRKRWLQEIAAACRSWEKVCAVEFTRTQDSRKADLRISSWYTDGRSRWGAPGSVAWGTYPKNRKKTWICLDRLERWSTRSADGFSGPTAINARAIVCHELGHVLGLAHNPPGFGPTVMAPQNTRGIDSPCERDVRAAQLLYGPPR